MKTKTLKKSKLSLVQYIRALFQKETPAYIKLTAGLALAYTIFPIDLLPDFFGLLGFADDAAVVGILTTAGMALLENYYSKQDKVIKDVTE